MKCAANFIGTCLVNISNRGLKEIKYPENAKAVSNGKDNFEKKERRSVSELAPVN